LIPNVVGKRCFIFKTSGEGLPLNDASSYQAIRLLKKKGFEVLSDTHFLMPYNIIFRFSDPLAKQMYVYSFAQSYLLAVHLMKEGKTKLPLNLYARPIPPLFRIEWWFSKANGRHFKVDMSKCRRCGNCVKKCPTSNITFDDERFHFGNRCVLCLKCSFNCPGDAISIGLLNNWKVNGDYHLESLASDPTVPFMASKPKGIIEKTALRYFKKIDSSLEKEGLSISDFEKIFS
jgi:ferredoxin